MGADGGFFCVGHVLSSLVPDQQGNLPLAAAGLFAHNSHFLHVEVHADLNLVLQHVQHLPLNALDLADSFALFVLGVEVEIVDGHGADGLAVECFNVLDLPAYSSALHYCLLDVKVAQQSLLPELLAPFLEDNHARELFPYLKVLLARIQSEVVDAVETVEYLLLLEELLELHKLDLVIEVLGEPSLRNDHVFAGVPFIELDYLPVVGVAPPVHVAKLLRHFPVDSTSNSRYFSMSMKS